jgi:hypothetical protein
VFVGQQLLCLFDFRVAECSEVGIALVLAVGVAAVDQFVKSVLDLLHAYLG